MGELVWGQLGHLDCEEAEEIKGESVFGCVWVRVRACVCVREREKREKARRKDEKRN